MDSFSDREPTAFTGGIEAAWQIALVAAVTIEVRDGAGVVRQQVAAAVLQGLADALAARADLPSRAALRMGHWGNRQ